MNNTLYFWVFDAIHSTVVIKITLLASSMLVSTKQRVVSFGVMLHRSWLQVVEHVKSYIG